MRVVWKEVLALNAKPQEVRLLEGAKILHVGVQKQDQIQVLTFWYEVDPTTATTKKRVLQVFGTGDDFIPEDATYLGTVQMGFYVWHLFELTPS